MESGDVQDKIIHVKAKTLTLHWHEGASAIYTIAAQPNKPGEKSLRLVTGAGDNNVRIWEFEYNENKDDIQGIKYLSSISKHTQAVNCVRFNKDGKLLATASDDGTIMIWEKNDSIVREFGQELDDDIKESWIMKIACFASNMSEIYDICWSPDSKYICCGLMDNIIRIFSVSTGSMVKQIAEHNHYVQGVAWDPRGEYICSQSADRSVHVYKVSLNEKGELNIGPTAFYKSVKSEVPNIRLSSLSERDFSKKSAELIRLPDSNPTTDTTSSRNSTPISTSTSISAATNKTSTDNNNNTISNSPIQSNSMAISQSNSSRLMEPPMQAPRHKRSYSNSSTSSSHSVANRCLSPLPLPAVMPSSPNHIHHNSSNNIMLSSTIPLTSPPLSSASPSINTNFNNNSITDNEPPVNYRQHYLYHNETLQSFFRRLTFSPDGSLLITTCGIYKPNNEQGKENLQNTVYVYIRSGLNKGPVVHLPGLRKPAIVVRFSPVKYKLIDNIETNVFSLPYRMLFGIATQDSILIYDTQRLNCVAVATSIHYAVITDIAWSSDGRSLFVSSNDGFVSCAVLSNAITGEIIGGFEETPDEKREEKVQEESKDRLEEQSVKIEKSDKDIAALLGGEGAKRRCI
jgi:chromatin assembly factor 1 subunit B